MKASNPNSLLFFISLKTGIFIQGISNALLYSKKLVTCCVRIVLYAFN